MEQDDEYELITPPDTLRGKVSYSATGVDASMLEKAEQVIAGLQDSYLEWVQEDLNRLQALYDKAAAEPGDRKPLLKDIFRIAHDVKGQGGSFGYDLMTQIGNQLCRFVEAVDDLDDGGMEVVKVHIDSMRLVINGRIEGNGGAAGDRMIAGLQAVVRKVTGK